MSNRGFEYQFRAPHSKPEDLGSAPPRYVRTVENGMIIERDLAVTLRDGVEIYINLFRPVDESPAAPLIGWGPYGKHGHIQYHDVFPNWGGNPAHYSQYCAFEAADPAYWVPRGYAIINPDTRGTWHCKGKATYLSPEEALDFYDLIEWAGTQPWSNGKVGLSGVSYLTSSQWRVAETNPPHLAAINPWEGWSDTYREVARHGGIPETFFWPYLTPRWGASTTQVEDLQLETRDHPFFDAFWESKAADFSKIRVPAYIVASWSDQGLHTRGTLEGFKRIASKEKWLEVHGRKKWAYFYEPESVRRQQQFFDHFLRGVPDSMSGWSPVTLESRRKYYVGAMQPEKEWPIARTQYTQLFLDAATAKLGTTPAAQEASRSYDATSTPGGPQRAEFDFAFTQATELIGHMKLRLWASVDRGDDFDLFVAIQKIGTDGAIVPFPFWAHFDDGPVALGWLRASHRELDAKRSTEYQPVLAHRRELKIAAGEIVPLDVEIWASGTQFDAGEGLRLVLQGSDIYVYPKPVMCDRHEQTVNQGRHIVHTGGIYDSHLLVPVIPKR
jgi:predicted acyl esterase